MTVAEGGLSWVKIAVDCSDEHVDSISAIFESAGAASVTVWVSEADRKSVEALFDGSVDALPSVMKELEHLKGVDHRHRISQTVLADRDWVRESQRQLKPVEVSHQLKIAAPWHSVAADEKVTVLINPGPAFGTGHHETTNLCARWLSELNLNGGRVVDYGCGSGILAIIALRLGADFAWGVDTDPIALANSRENAILNAVQDRYQSCLPTEFPADLQVDVVVANLLADALVELNDDLTRLTRPSGWLIVSGLLESQIERVSRAYSSGFEFAVRHLGQWAVLAGRRNEESK